MLETFGQNLKETLGPLAGWFAAHVFSPNDLRSWLGLAAVLIAVDLLYRCWSRPRSESFWSYSAPWRIYTHPSAVLEYKYFFVRHVVDAILLAPMVAFTLVMGNWGSKVISEWLGPGPGWTPGSAALVLFAVGGVLLVDTGHYISHYIQHKVPFLWEFHKVHHAAEVLTPVTAFRAHPVEIIVDSLFQSPLQALGLAVFQYLYGGRPSLITFVGIGAIVAFLYLIDNLRHSHLWISFGPRLEHILSSPAQHQIHHSTAPHHLNRNLAQYFSFLDWIGGTLCVTSKSETLNFGLVEGPDPELKTIWSLYWVPFKRAFRILRSSPPQPGQLVSDPVRPQAELM